jgi:hypothetical protein
MLFVALATAFTATEALEKKVDQKISKLPSVKAVRAPMTFRNSRRAKTCLDFVFVMPTGTKMHL